MHGMSGKILGSFEIHAVDDHGKSWNSTDAIHACIVIPFLKALSGTNEITQRDRTVAFK